MLFRKTIDPRCAYCRRGGSLENGQVICEEKLSTAAETVHLEKIFFNGNKERKIPYRITVTVDEAADGTAQDASLGLSFRWSVLSAESKEGDAK